MDTSVAAPLVNFQQLSSYPNRRVRLAGAIVSQQNDMLQVKAADDGTVNVKLRAPQSFDDKYVLITGIATGRDTITEEKSQGIGNDYDLAKHNEMCKLYNSPQFSAIFV